MPRLNLVTGAGGFIGSHLTRCLLHRGERVRAFVRNPRSLRDAGLEGRPGLEIFEGDLLDPKSLPRALEGVGTLYHLAGLISTSPRDRLRVWQLNCGLARKVLETCRIVRPEKIVFLGSIFGLGGGGPEPVDEETLFNLGDCPVEYVRAKRGTEIYVQECLDSGLPVIRAYPCYCYGPGDVHLTSSRLLLAFLRRRIPAYLRGGQNALDVRDAARGLALAGERGQPGERYILGGTNLEYGELFRILSNVTGIPPPRLVVPSGMGRLLGRALQTVVRDPIINEGEAFLMSRCWFYDDSKARRALGHASRDLAEALGPAVDWLSDRGLAPRPPGRQSARKTA